MGTSQTRKRWTFTRAQLFHFGMGAVLLTAGASAVDAWWNRATPEQIALGQQLFEHKWTVNDPLAGGGDGLGPVFNAQSCAECHHQGGLGGGGGSKFNVKTFTALPTRERRNSVNGVVHAFAVNKSDREAEKFVSVLYPTPPNPPPPPPGHCGYLPPPPPNPLSFEMVNTPALFGSGVIDSLSDWSIKSAAMERTLGNMKRELSGNFDDIPTGRIRKLSGGRIGKFGWKGQFATLEEFVGAACAMEIGLSNSHKRQQVPRHHKDDVDAKPDMTDAQITAMVKYTAQLPVPVQQTTAKNAAQCAEGEQLFASIGCAACHTPDLGSAKGVYSDFCLYTLDDEPGAGYSDPVVPLPPDEPLPSEWKTPPLWGVADSAPYMHDGSATTLRDAILAHGGAARKVRQRFNELGDEKQKAVVAFLASLKAPRE